MQILPKVARENAGASPGFPDLRSPLVLRVSVAGFGFCFSQSRAITRDHGDSRSPLPASLSQNPTPHRRFVESKGQTPIRPSGRPNGRSLFLCFSAV